MDPNNPPLNLALRFARPSDLSALTRIYNQAIAAGNATADQDAQTEEMRATWMRQFDERAYPLYVAVLDDQVVGYGYLSRYRSGRKALGQVAEISYYLDYDFHGQGIGTAIMEQLIAHAKEIGKTTLVAILMEVNTPSIALLEKNGFDLWGRLPDVVELPTGNCAHLIYGLRMH